MQTEGEIRVAVAGQPNTGKSTIFNGLTGLRQEVGNWSGKTVEKKLGRAVIDGRRYVFVDLPGTYSLLARSEEERIAADYIVNERPDCVIVVANAADLRRTLNYLVDILLLEIPCLLAVNMVDVAGQHGVTIDMAALERALGIPCVGLVASKRQGIRALAARIADAARPDAAGILAELVHLLPERERSWMEAALAKRPQNVPELVFKRALWKSLEGDIRAVAQTGESDWGTRPEDAAMAAQAARFAWLEKRLGPCLTRDQAGDSLTRRCDRFLLHPVLGYVCIAVILLFAICAGLLIGYPTGIWISVLLQECSELVLSIMPESWNIIRALVQSVFLSAMSLICMVPLIAIFYFIFSFLEEVGYMPRVSFLMDSLMSRLGLNGMSFTPLLFALPCNIPGIIGIRSIATVKQRIHTLLLIPLVPCSSKIIVLMTLCGWMFAPGWSVLAAAGIMFLSFVIFIAVSLGLKNSLFRKGAGYDMLMELPQYHMPNFRIIGTSVLHHTLAFLKKASTIIFGFGIILWFLSYYPSGSISTSYLSMTGRFLDPVAGLMGIDWKLLTSLMTSALSRETVLPTMALLYNVPVEQLKDCLQLQVGAASAISFLAAQFLSMPCLPALGMLLKESGSLKITLAVAVCTIVLPMTVAIIMYQIISLLF